MTCPHDPGYAVAGGIPVRYCPSCRLAWPGVGDGVVVPVRAWWRWPLAWSAWFWSPFLSRTPVTPLIVAYRVAFGIVPLLAVNYVVG